MEQTEYSLKKSLEKRLEKIEEQLNKVRGASPLTHGWQTKRLAKAQRTWDILASEKRSIIAQLNAMETFGDMFHGDILP